MAAPRNTSAMVGWGLSFLIGALFAFSAVMKLTAGPDAAKELAKMGLTESMLLPLAILELVCLALYLIPPTSVIGAILLTGYIGGTIITHWRVGDLFIVQIVVGVLIWVALCLRENRLWRLIPIRTAPPREPLI